MAACAASKACSMTSSDTSLAPASTIVIASIVPHTIRSSSESSICVISGLTTICPPTRPMRTAPTGPEEGQRRDRQRSGGAVDREGVMAVLAVDREHGADDLHLVAEALGPERPDRPVDHARVQGGLLGGLALALEEAARDLAGGVHLLLDVDGEGEEVGSLTRLAATDGRGEHDRGAAAHGDRTVGLAGQLAGREGDLLAPDVDRHGGLVQLQFAHSLSCFLKPCRVCARRFAAPSRGRRATCLRLAPAQRRRPSSAISLRYDSRSVRAR